MYSYVCICSALIDISVEALGEVSLFPSLICLLGHAMAVYESQSTVTSQSDDTTRETQDIDSANSNGNNISFILISKSAKKKAQRSMRISQSEEIFQTILEGSLKVYIHFYIQPFIYVYVHTYLYCCYLTCTLSIISVGFIKVIAIFSSAFG